MAVTFLNSSFNHLPHPQSSSFSLYKRKPAITLSFLNSSPHRRGARRKRGRSDAFVVRAGPPSKSNLIYAFVFPLSLIIGTIFASLRIADRLDEQYLEEEAINRAIMEENEAFEFEEGDEDEEEEEEEEGDDGSESDEIASEETVPVEVAATPRSRNRPKKLV